MHSHIPPPWPAELAAELAKVTEAEARYALSQAAAILGDDFAQLDPVALERVRWGAACRPHGDGGACQAARAGAACAPGATVALRVAYARHAPTLRHPGGRAGA